MGLGLKAWQIHCWYGHRTFPLATDEMASMLNHVEFSSFLRSLEPKTTSTEIIKQCQNTCTVFCGIRLRHLFIDYIHFHPFLFDVVISKDWKNICKCIVVDYLLVSRADRENMNSRKSEVI